MKLSPASGSQLEWPTWQDRVIAARQTAYAVARQSTAGVTITHAAVAGNDSGAPITSNQRQKPAHVQHGRVEGIPVSHDIHVAPAS